MSLYKYFELTDNINKGVITRINETHPSKQYKYIPKEKKWVCSGIMIEYLWPESPLHEMYEEITEEEAMKRIAEMK